MKRCKIIPGWTRFTRWPAAAGLALCLGSGTAQSQDSLQISPPPPAKAVQASQPATASPKATPTATATPVTVPNSPVLIVDMRSEADIQSDLDATRALKPKAQAEEQRASGDFIQSKAILEIKKKELDGLKARLDLAKKGGNASEFATLDRQRQHAELGIKLQERLVAVRESQVELGQARRKLADAGLLALTSELEMGKKRTSWDSLTQNAAKVASASASAQDIVALQVNIRSDERRVLLAMQDRSEQGEAVARKESQLIERQIGVLEADTAIQQFATRAH